MVLADAQWSPVEPLMEACRPRAKVPPSNLRRTVEAIVRRCRNGAKWRAVPAASGPWWMAAQTFTCWARLGVWDRLLDMAKAKEVGLGLVFPTAPRSGRTPRRRERRERGIWRKPRRPCSLWALILSLSEDLVVAMALRPS